MPVQIDHENATPRNPTHLTQNLHHLIIDKVMRKQRTDHVVKLGIRKRQRQRIATHGTYLLKPLRLLINRLRRSFIQLESDRVKLALRFPGPSRRDAHQLSGSRANIKHRKTLQPLRFDLTKQRSPYTMRIAHPTIDELKLADTGFI